MERFSKSDFYLRLKDDFYSDETKSILEHFESNKNLKYIYNQKENKGKFSISPDNSKEESEFEHKLFNKMEDIAIFEKNKLIDTDVAYQGFGYYYIIVFLHAEFKKYFKHCREIAPGKFNGDIYSGIDRLGNKFLKIANNIERS